MQRLVIDTNVALDLLLFRDPAVAGLATQLTSGALAWIATGAMRDELARVLGYPQIARAVAHRAGGDAGIVLDAFDARVRRVEPAPKAPFTCGDADDQMFVDLAVAHRAVLLSKDREVLRMARRLARLDVRTLRAWPME